MGEKKYSMKDDFSMLALMIIPVSVAVNFVGGQLASILKLPMYLDTIGTIFAAMLCGNALRPMGGSSCRRIDQCCYRHCKSRKLCIYSGKYYCRSCNRLSCEKENVQRLVEVDYFNVHYGGGFHYFSSAYRCARIWRSYRRRHIDHYGSGNGGGSKYLGGIFWNRGYFHRIGSNHFLCHMLACNKGNSAKDACKVRLRKQLHKRKEVEYPPVAFNHPFPQL